MEPTRVFARIQPTTPPLRVQEMEPTRDFLGIAERERADCLPPRPPQFTGACWPQFSVLHTGACACRRSQESWKRRRSARGLHYCTVDMPGATTSLPGLDINSSKLKVFIGAGLVGVDHMSDGNFLDCWVLNVANKTCRQLPRLFLSSRCYAMQRCRWELSSSDWQIWLEPAPESSGSSDTLSSFRIVLMAFHPCAIDSDASASPALYTYSSTSNDWPSVHHRIRPHPMWSVCVDNVTKGGCVRWFRDIGDFSYEGVRMSWDSDCITQLPDPPLGHLRPQHRCGVRVESGS